MALSSANNKFLNLSSALDPTHAIRKRLFWIDAKLARCEGRLEHAARLCITALHLHEFVYFDEVDHAFDRPLRGDVDATETNEEEPPTPQPSPTTKNKFGVSPCKHIFQNLYQYKFDFDALAKEHTKEVKVPSKAAPKKKTKDKDKSKDKDKDKDKDKSKDKDKVGQPPPPPPPSPPPVEEDQVYPISAEAVVSDVIAGVIGSVLDDNVETFEVESELEPQPGPSNPPTPPSTFLEGPALAQFVVSKLALTFLSMSGVNAAVQTAFDCLSDLGDYERLDRFLAALTHIRDHIAEKGKGQAQTDNTTLKRQHNNPQNPKQNAKTKKNYLQVSLDNVENKSRATNKLIFIFNLLRTFFVRRRSSPLRSTLLEAMLRVREATPKTAFQPLIMRKMF